MIQKRPSWLPLIDLRAVTRDSEHVETVISVRWQGVFFPWLRLGSLTRTEDTWLGAHYGHGVTDEEHHGAYAVRIDVRGLALEHCHGGVWQFGAWIAGAAEAFDSLRVPDVSMLSVSEIPTRRLCESCETPHLIATFNPSPECKLWGQIRGCRIRIETFPVNLSVAPRP